MNVQDLKTEISLQVQQSDDFNSLYKTYYTITSSKLESSVKELFELKGLKSEVDFDYFMNYVLFDPDAYRYSHETMKVIEDIKDGKMFDQDFLSKSKDFVCNLRDFVDDRMSTKVLKKMVSHIPTDWGGGSVGKGEFAFIVLADGCKKAAKGGDLNLNGVDVEVKGNGAKMANQTSHVSLRSAVPHLKQWVYNNAGIEVDKLETVNAQRVRDFYMPLFKDNAWLMSGFLIEAFSRVMVRWPREKFHWMYDCASDEGFDFQKFRQMMAVFEFEYYKECDHFDRVLFINTDNMNMVNVDEMSIDKLQHFRLDSPQYRFNVERTITTYWNIK